MSFQIKYRGRFPVQQKRADNTFGCRGCGSDIPKGRQSWCSKACYKTYCPSEVIRAVKRRDGGICQICKDDIFAPLRDGRKQPHLWRSEICKAEYDHIVPMCEGGITVLENLRTACQPCHRKLTRELAARRAKARRDAALPPELFPLPETL